MLDAAERLGLSVPTAALDSAQPGCRTIDHVAVPRSVRGRHVEAMAVPRRLSDHHAYVVDIEVLTAVV